MHNATRSPGDRSTGNQIFSGYGQLDEHSQPGPSVSVVVPSYNHADFVAACLNSIIKQSLQPSRLLVIDDGSTDGSPQVIDAILQNCPFPCELIARENRGLSQTLNQALKLTGGDYFAYLSSDDIWLSNFLTERIELLRSRPTAVLAYGNAYFIDKQNRVVDCTADWAPYKDGDVRKMLVNTTAPMSPTVVYRRTALKNHGWNESARLEDFELYLRLSIEGDFAFDPRVLSAWRWHEKNTSWNQAMMLDEHISALRRVAPRLGIVNNELESLIRNIRFNRAEDFLRVGEKKKAVQLALQNLGAARSPRLVSILTRLVLPYSLVSWRRRRKQESATTRYGTLANL